MAKEVSQTDLAIGTWNLIWSMACPDYIFVNKDALQQSYERSAFEVNWLVGRELASAKGWGWAALHSLLLPASL